MFDKDDGGGLLTLDLPQQRRLTNATVGRRRIDAGGPRVASRMPRSRLGRTAALCAGRRGRLLRALGTT